MTPVFVFAVDTDGDGLTDKEEAYYYTDKNNPDTDGDGFLDGTEIANDYSAHAADGVRMHQHDVDGDGLNDWLERWFGSDIGQPDSDNDGFTDYEEVMQGFSPSSATTSRFAREIVIDRTTQQLYVFTDGLVIKTFPVSTGNPESETPAGEFNMLRKVPEKSYVGSDYNLPGVKWNIEFKPMYYIHTAYWHNDFGVRTHSHGCVNMREADAKVIYDVVDETVPIRIEGETPSTYWVQA